MPIPIPISGDLSLYIHLPFCQKKCDYCHFFVLPNKETFKQQLLKALLLEIDLRAPLISSSQIQSIYFGGGTPALVGPGYIETLLKRIQQYTSLENLEITLEFNPENHDFHLLKAYREIGVNRLSFGVQSFDAELLKKIGRTHSPQDSIEAVQKASSAGFKNITIDLMYDLPTQTLNSWKDTLSWATDLPVTHLSLYNLSIEKETVFYKRRKEIQAKMPSGDLSLEMFSCASSHFKSKGFAPYEISAFCKEGYYSRHNTGYWLQRPHLGLGPSAFSLLPPHRFQNVKNLKKYSTFLEGQKLAIDFEERLNKEAFLRESLVLNLRLLEGLDPRIFQKRFGTFNNELNELLCKLKQRGWMSWDPQKIALTQEGLLYHDAIASELVI